MGAVDPDVRIDSDRCTGHGRCYTLAAEIFEDDEQGFGQVRANWSRKEAGAEILAKLDRAVRACPEGAVMRLFE